MLVKGMGGYSKQLRQKMTKTMVDKLNIRLREGMEVGENDP